jgi:hypothetical protein
MALRLLAYLLALITVPSWFSQPEKHMHTHPQTHIHTHTGTYAHTQTCVLGNEAGQRIEKNKNLLKLSGALKLFLVANVKS